MRTILSLLFLVGGLLPALLAAQPGPPTLRGPHEPGVPERFGETDASRLDVLSDYLELSDAQRYEVEAIFEAGRTERQAAAEAQRETAAALRDELDVDTPDPRRVGELVIALERQKETFAAAGQAQHDAIAALLTPEQKERYDALEAARDLRPKPPGPRHYRRPSRRAAPGGATAPPSGSPGAF